MSHLHARSQHPGQEPQGALAGVPRRRGAGLERVRGRRDAEKPLGGYYQRRQVVQAAQLGTRPGRGVEMRSSATGQTMVLACLLVAALAESGCQRAAAPSLPTIPTKSGIDMVLIPAGSFAMGSRQGREDEG